MGRSETNATGLRETRVQPIADARDPEAPMREGQSAEKFWRSASGLPDPDSHMAPPSIMQIKISQMLDQQAVELETKTEGVDRSEQKSKDETIDPAYDRIMSDKSDDEAVTKLPSEVAGTETEQNAEPANAKITPFARYAEAANLSRSPAQEAVTEE
ncbi:hypothetical protein [Tropicibacter naphthalenivorans]|uniref:hypothetical protein n=1 Tax=Tropicibacter naphthalenivorans TaxID=441103 RepID=UPI00117EB85E|nr:hypothetical protein [Tropicibacter naphthalenivorans]